jgi:hypothetical protein
VNPSIGSSQTAEFNMEERSDLGSRTGTIYVDSEEATVAKPAEVILP